MVQITLRAAAHARLSGLTPDKARRAGRGQSRKETAHAQLAP
ncbi:MAG: hypothetical protein ACK41V_05890 [Acidovorax sp.]